MGRLGQNPSSRGYATPTYATTSLTARETFGGTSKAGLGRHIGMGPFTYSAIVNGSSGHQASFLAGNSFPAAFRAGQLLDMKYPISDTNQLARVGTGTTGGMTRTPADGVNLNEREEMQTRVDKWNKVWPAMPQRDTPNGCCKTIPHLNQDDDHTNITANETLYSNSGPFGDTPTLDIPPLAPPRAWYNPIGAVAGLETEARFTNMPRNGLQGVSFYNLLYGQCGGVSPNTENQFGDWGTSYITNPAIYKFVKDQGFNCIRFPLTIYPGSGNNGDFGDGCDNNYFTTFLGPDPSGIMSQPDGWNLIDAIVTGVEKATEAGLYSIINWHTYGISTDGQYDMHGKYTDASGVPTGWEVFFYNMMSKLAVRPNIEQIKTYLIWEIFNEPKEEWTKWDIGDFPYPKAHIDAIRKFEGQFLNGTEHLIIVGTNFNSRLLASSDDDIPPTLPLVNRDDNICFALHFYTGTHNAKMIRSWGFKQNDSKVGVVYHEKLSKYFPVFISECGPTKAGGTGDPDYEGWKLVFTDLNLWANGSPGRVQPRQPIVVWALTGLDNATPPKKPLTNTNVLINEQATAESFTASPNMNNLTKLFFGPSDLPFNRIPTWCALSGANNALDTTAGPNGRRWQGATSAKTNVNKFVSNFTSDTITIGPVQVGGSDNGELANYINAQVRYTSRQLFLWNDRSKPLYISYKMNLKDIYCNNSAVFFLIFPNSTCRTPSSQQPQGATKNYCDAPASGPTFGKCQELDLMETDGKFYFASTWHPITGCEDKNINTYFSTYSLFSGRTPQPKPSLTPPNFVTNISPDISGWTTGSTDFYLPVSHRFQETSPGSGRAEWAVMFNGDGYWWPNDLFGNGANTAIIDKVQQQLFKSLGGDSDENNAYANGAGFRLILGINSTRPVSLTNAWNQGGDTGSEHWHGSTIDDFQCNCANQQGNMAGANDSNTNVGMQAWYLQNIALDNATTISADLITQTNLNPYLIPDKTIGFTAGLLP